MNSPLQDSRADSTRLDLRGSEPVLDLPPDELDPRQVTPAFAAELRELLGSLPAADVEGPIVVAVSTKESAERVDGPMRVVVSRSEKRPVEAPPSFSLDAGAPSDDSEGEQSKADDVGLGLRAKANDSSHARRVTAPRLRWGVMIAGLALFIAGAAIVFSKDGDDAARADETSIEPSPVTEEASESDSSPSVLAAVSPVTSTPTTAAPTTAAPATAAPTSAAPTSEAPAPAGPTTEAPDASLAAPDISTTAVRVPAPTTPAPTTAAPTSAETVAAPTTAAPTTAAPTTAAPTTAVPTTAAPTTAAPVTVPEVTFAPPTWAPEPPSSSAEGDTATQ